MAEVLKFEYTGTMQPRHNQRDDKGHLLSPYLPGEALVEAVNLAIHLERPLLLKGEPGCGKTRLAQAVAYELGLPYEAWHIKSTSRARDGLYTYDAVGRLRDAQLAAANHLPDRQLQRMRDPAAYVRLGALGRAFQNEQRTVLLIDEIDKADIDFPNDLLLELDEQRFYIEETGEEVMARNPPIVFITSNDERDLPNAFLRRCLFFGIEFPARERLVEIITAHFPESSEEVVSTVVAHFSNLREELYKDKRVVSKRISTSELIDWFRVLDRYPHDEILAKLNGKLPHLSVLLKSWDEHNRYLKQVGAQE